MEGLLESPWEGKLANQSPRNRIYNSKYVGGIFRVDLLFDEEYNEKPPAVQFVTVPFHPNSMPSFGKSVK